MSTSRLKTIDNGSDGGRRQSAVGSKIDTRYNHRYSHKMRNDSPRMNENERSNERNEDGKKSVFKTIEKSECERKRDNLLFDEKILKSLCASLRRHMFTISTHTKIHLQAEIIHSNERTNDDEEKKR